MNPSHANRIFPLFALALLAAASFWLEHITRSAEPRADGHLRHDPDFIIDNFSIRRYDPQGHLQHTLSARQMRHYPDDDSSLVDQPAIIYQASMPPLELSARQALISKDGEEVHLKQEVLLVRAAGFQRPALHVMTDELRVHPEAETAHTDTPVTIIDGGNTLHGKGMDADNKRQIYRLNGPTHGTLQARSTARP